MVGWLIHLALWIFNIHLFLAELATSRHAPAHPLISKLPLSNLKFTLDTMIPPEDSGKGSGISGDEPQSTQPLNLPKVSRSISSSESNGASALAGEADFKTKMTVFQQDKDHLKVVNSVNHALPAAFVQTNAKPEVVLGPKSQITSPEGTKVAASAVSFARLDPSKFPRDLDVEEDTLGCIFKGTLFQHGANVNGDHPCDKCRCNMGLVACSWERCDGSPGFDCVPLFVPGACCPLYSCGNSSESWAQLSES